MAISYQGNHFEIDCKEHTICYRGKVSAVRPKTFQLLIQLIEHDKKVVSKRVLLETIWDDVTVEDHVIVQSIAELRKIFAGQTVIQTLPRKGYAWVADVKRVETHTAGVSKPALSNQSKALDNRQMAFQSKALAALVVLSLVCLVFFLSQSHSKDKVGNKTVFILPTKNRLMDSTYDWVSLGIMDALIAQAQDQSKVMPLDYVLSSMRVAKMGRDFDRKQVQRLLHMTQAHTIVESEISRRLGEFQMVYRLHQQNNIKRGVVFDKSLDELTLQLGRVVGSVSDSTVQELTIFNSPFNNELFVEALTQAREGNLPSAISLIQSLITIEPNNLEAYRVLIDWLQYQQSYEQALIYSSKALGLLEGGAQDKSSFYYRHGYNLFRLSRLDEAWAVAKRLKQDLKNESNPLYLGFSDQLEGELLLAFNQTQQAKLALTRALKHFERVGHSIGMTTIHILLGNVERALNNPIQQEFHHKNARDIVEKYQIEELLRLFKVELPPQ